MEHETQTNSETEKLDRTLTIKCTPTLIWHSVEPRSIGASMAFAQIDSNPNMPKAVNPGTGDLSIRHMPENAKYSNDIDITFVLDPSNIRDADGNLLTGDNVARWAYANEGPSPDEPLGYFWFCQLIDAEKREYNRDVPIIVDGMAISRVDDLHILVDDDTPTTAPPYAFCLAFVLPIFGGYYISIDPVISTRGIGGEHFMMKE